MDDKGLSDEAKNKGESKSFNNYLTNAELREHMVPYVPYDVYGCICSLWRIRCRMFHCSDCTSNALHSCQQDARTKKTRFKVKTYLIQKKQARSPLTPCNILKIISIPFSIRLSSAGNLGCFIQRPELLPASTLRRPAMNIFIKHNDFSQSYH